MRIEIEANANFYLEVSEVKPTRFILDSKSDLLKWDGKLYIEGEYFMGELPVNEFNKLAERIRGCEYYDVQRILWDSGLMVESELKESAVSIHDAIKALFNIYYWTESLFYSSETETINQLNDILHDQFVLDYKSKPGPQRDLYLLPTNMIEARNNKFLENLFSINLLDRLTISHLQPVQTYFVPFFKPDLRKSKFISLFPDIGLETFSFWQQILYFRDKKIREFLKM